MLFPHNQAARDTVLGHLQPFAEIQDLSSLVLLSGGLDSVALLATLLQHTSQKVYALHVEIRDAHNRWHAERAAVDNCLTYLKKYYRSFETGSVRYEMMAGDPTHAGSDISITSFMAARVNIAMGSPHHILWSGHVRNTPFEYQEGGAMFAANQSFARRKPVWLMPFLNFLEFDIYAAIPPALADMTWSCWYPRYSNYGNALTCGKCLGCTTRDSIKLLADSRKLAESSMQPVIENYTPAKDTPLETVARRWPCLSPRFDAARHVMRCGVCENCRKLIEFEEQKRSHFS